MRNTENEDRLRALLGPERGKNVFWLTETDSTNRQLRTLAESGAEAGTVLLADAQTAGRGRLGRSFASPMGKGLYLSYLLRPEISPAELGKLTPWAAVAVRRAVQAVCGLEADIKWVNDLLCHGRKLCGILTEGAFREGRLRYAVLGIGLNVTALPEDLPTELREKATSVYRETGDIPDRTVLAAAIGRALDALPELWESGDEAYYREYRAHCVTLGRQVRLSSGETGFAAGLDRDYALLLRSDDGTERRVLSGEALYTQEDNRSE